MSAAKILVVDDNTSDISLLRIALDRQREEYELRVMVSGDEALRFVQEHQPGPCGPEPCVILLDLHLPRYDGLAILQAIRQTPALTHVFVIVLSGLASPAEQRKIAGMGALYRQKPFDIEEFFELGAEIFAICRNSTAAAMG